ncbi:MAG TPA: hypothetical protein VGM03_15625 [Phycisphaerae bacterium]|jgi:hypothetical protein
MIEFKAECGHTIRAKDEDEGKVVRCSYCGKDAQVPQDEQDGGLDFLFAEVQRAGAQQVAAPASKRGRGRRHRSTVGTPRREGEFDWVDATKKMAFFAVLIIAAVLVWKVVVPALTQPSHATAPPPLPPVEESHPAVPSAPTYGLVHMSLDNQKGGLYVNSVPAGARVYLRKFGGKGDIWKDPSVDRSLRTERAIPLEPGKYELAVALVVNDSTLMNYPRYKEVRRAIESGGGAGVVEGFFLPDGSTETLPADMGDDMPKLIARKYPDVIINEKQWSALVALFVPDVSISELVSYIPQRTAFRFDPAHVKSELSYYDVPLPDQRFVMDVLERLGIAIYRKAPGDYQVFSINLTEGWLSHRELKGRGAVRAPGTGKKE